MAVVKGKIFFKVKTKFCFYSQLNYSHPRTAIEAEILFTARIKHLRFLKRPSGKTPRGQSRSGKKIGAESAVLHFVFFEVIVNKMQQSAKENCLLKRNTMPEVFPLTAILAGSGKTMPFEKRHAGCEEREKINRRRIYDTLRINFFEATKQTACIFSKGEETGVNYYGARYLDPKYSRWISTDPALSEYMAGSSVGAGGIYNTVNFNVYHYGNNNPIKYTDPTGMWIDNGDGTYTAEKGDTLWDKYGADWKEKSGFTRDPRTLQVGETVGEKNIPTYSDASAEMKQQIPQGNAQDSNQNVVASKKSNDVAFSYGFGGKLALVLGLGAESGFIGDTSGNLYWYLSGSVGCGIQTPSTTKTDLSTLQYLKSAKGFSGGVSLDPTQVGKSSSLTADICLGVTGTYDLNNQKSSGLPNSWGFGSVVGGVWKTGTIVVPIYKKER